MLPHQEITKEVSCKKRSINDMEKMLKLNENGA